MKTSISVLYIICVWTWFFLRQHHYLVDKTRNPLLAETKTFIVCPDCNYSFHHTSVLKIILIKDVRHGFLRHRVDCFLHERRHTQLELHQITCKHHDILSKVLKLYQISLHILYLPAYMAMFL